MLKNIDYQISSDEEIQKQYESQLAPYIQKRFTNNLKAFASFDSELAQTLSTHHSVTFSPFVTHKKRLSIMNVLKGRALYELIPERQVNEQVEHFRGKALIFDSSQPSIKSSINKQYGATLNSILPGVISNYQPINEQSENLVILGCGLGLHLKQLATLSHWKNILIVEPELDLLHVSLLSAPWRELLGHVSENDIKLNIVSGVKGRSSIESIKEWKNKLDISKFHVYRHYNYVEFNYFEYDLALGLDPFSSDILEKRAPQNGEQNFEFSHSLSYYYFDRQAVVEQVEAENSLLIKNKFNHNLQSFKRYFPDIFEFASGYESVRWQLISTDIGKFNLFDLEQGVVFSTDDPQNASKCYFEHYSGHPRIEALDARQTFHKPSPFIHYEKSAQLKSLVQAIPDSKRNKLPYKLPSFIMYGAGLAYQIELLLNNHMIDNFILYEPNIDFFFSSLSTIDWSNILEKYDERGAKLYLNIGDDGTHMFDDIHLRLQSYGIHILSYTFFYVSYFQHEMDKNIKLTREQFKVLLNVSEFYDHAFYNLNHTRDSFMKNCRYMLRNKPKSLAKTLADTPVFIIGNGPSLDVSAEVIRHYQDKVIIISVGTSLKALYQLGIKPDYHAEVEQTRATLHWVCQVPDPDWLKQIDIISVNGLHPEVADMFGDALYCLKTGEAGSLSYLEVADEVNNLDSILYSYPTVSNCALSYALRLGFRQIYLFGVDLGFINPAQHHSKHSAYFNAKAGGGELYDYNTHGTGLRVKGNFENYVFTKHEFKYSAEILSKSIAEFGDAEVYNTANGAFIDGTTPLKLEQVLILGDDIDKLGLKNKIKDEAYFDNTAGFVDLFDKKYLPTHLEKHCDQLLEIIREEAHSWDDVLSILDRQVVLVKSSARDPHSLFYYLMRGSASFCLTYLTRLAYSSDDEKDCMQRFKEGKEVWEQYIIEMKNKSLYSLGEFDQTPRPVPDNDFESMPALDILNKRK
ncbi:motility associated factor glycosyltransferase family protein [Agarivorans sp. Z349TD_8]|uniref:motility associated factor glycosyltransferase family protein n=1 Tax=Agarivorans sp. Z349TD_8 TaxID=3421434 RepID=UPI003D7EFC78